MKKYLFWVTRYGRNVRQWMVDEVGGKEIRRKVIRVTKVS